ncbi:MAG: carboxypeptidase regulatory-like domain-containing protein, partial [Terriglobia bacterium]
MKGPLRKAAACLGFLFFSYSLAMGQTTFGTLVGTVSDPSGAVVPAVQVTLTNTATNAKQITATNSDGIYEFVNVLPGSYRVDAEKAGFKHFSRSPVVVQVQQSYRLDVDLQVGVVTQTVSVTGETPLLQPQTSSLGQVIAGRSVTEMPLNGRNVFNLMELAPSVIPQGQSEGTSIGQNAQGPQNYQVNGAIAGLSAFYLDGMPMNNAYFFNASFLPTQDSIQEFKVHTNNLGPQWGGFAGGVMNLSTKSGTNEIHGAAYEYLRNKALNANNFFNNRAGIPVGAFTQNQFGIDAGGPVYFPGLYNGRDKSFWFFSYEGIRLRQGESFTESVPTAAEDAGDFSNLRTRSGSLIPIYNPLTVCGELGNAPCAVGANGQPVYTRQQFAGNMIPSSMINPTSKALENLWAPPNTPGQQFTNFNNWTGTAPFGGDNNEYVARFDQNVSDKQHFFARFSSWGQGVLATDPYKSG